MKLYDLKAGLNPRRVRIFLAEKGLNLPRVEIDLPRGDNKTPEFLRLNPLGKLPVLELDDGSVRIFLAEKGLEIPRVESDLPRGDNKTPEFLRLNPLGKLPVLELDDGSVLTESVAICHYLESLHPEPNLCGRDALERAQIEMWDRRMEFDAAAHAIGAFVHLHPFWIGRETQVAAFGELSRDKLLQRMAWLNDELAEREFIAAGRYTLADITLQCALVMAKGIGIRIPEQHSNLARWFAAVTARPTARA